MTLLLRLLFALSGIVAVSAVAHAVVAAPVFSPATGTYLSAQTMTLSTATSGASIAYTTNGTTPTESGGTVTNGSLYTIPVTISATTTLQAIAFASGSTDSPVTSVTYTIISLPAVAVPVFSPGGGTYTSMQPVTITSATNGAAIRYTTDGSTPSPTVGTLFYPGSLNIGATTTLNAIAYEAGYNPSAVTNATYTINLPTPAAAPIFSPGGGTYTSVQSVTISSPTSGTSVAYTTDGSTPTEVAGNITHGSLYTGALSFNTTVQLQAIAFGTGHTDSPVTSAIYQIDLPPPAFVPAFNPPTGQYETAQTVQIGSSTNGASIVYTTDGSTPTENGGTVTHGTQLANGGTINVPVGGVTTVNAIAFAPGYSDSAVGTATYTIVPATAPTFSPAPGNYTTNSNFSITPSAPTSGAIIVATTDGSQPSVNIAANGTITPGNGVWYANNSVMLTYPGGFAGPITINAMTIAPGYAPSAIVAANYNISLPPAAGPSFSPPAGAYTNNTGFPVAISTSTTGIDGSAGIIVYTTDGSTPAVTVGAGGVVTGIAHGYTLQSGQSITLGTGPLTINALAFAAGYSASGVAPPANYNISLPQANPPTFSPGNGAYPSTQSVAISGSTASLNGAPTYIVYTTDGSTPTANSSGVHGIGISNGASVPISSTLKAIAVANGYAPSSVASPNYSGWINSQASLTNYGYSPSYFVDYNISDQGGSYPSGTTYGSSITIDLFKTGISVGPGYVLWETYTTTYQNGLPSYGNYSLVMARYIRKSHSWSVQTIEGPFTNSQSSWYFTFNALSYNQVTGNIARNPIVDGEDGPPVFTPFTYPIPTQQL